MTTYNRQLKIKCIIMDEYNENYDIINEIYVDEHVPGRNINDKGLGIGINIVF